MAFGTSGSFTLTRGKVSLLHFSHSNRYMINHVVLICISLMINDNEHLFMYLLTTHTSSLVKCLLTSFTHFLFFIFGCIGSSLRCAGFLWCGEPGLLFVAVRRLLLAVASLVVEHGL